MNLETQIEITNGAFKPLGDCTAADLDCTAELRRHRADLASKASEALKAAAESCDPHPDPALAEVAAEAMRKADEAGAGRQQ